MGGSVSIQQSSNLSIIKFDYLKEFEKPRQYLKQNYPNIENLCELQQHSIYQDKQRNLVLKKEYFDSQLELNINLKQELLVKNLKNINIIKYHELFFIQNENYPKQKFQLYIVMDRCDMSLQQLMDEKKKNKEKFQQDELYHYVYQIYNGIKYLHKNKISHRDLKPQNILLKKCQQNDDFYVVNIADYGTLKNTSSLYNINYEKSCQGTKLFWPEELFNIQSKINNINYFKQDIFAFGLIILIMCGIPNIDIVKEIKGVQLAQNNKFDFSKMIEKYIKEDQNQNLNQLLTRLLQKDVKQRPTVEDLDQHPLLFKMKENLKFKYGKIKDNPNEIYEGHILNNQKNGLGIQNEKSGVYIGEWYENKKNGYGKYIYNNKEIYEGHWLQNERSGKGKKTYKNGDIYEGNWLKNKFNGYGQYFYKNGDIYKGNWLENKKHGQGEYTYKNGTVFQGVYCDNLQSGVIKYKNGDIYNGNLKLNQKHGQGKYQKANGQVFDGFWENDKLKQQPNGLYKNKQLLQIPQHNGELEFSYKID